MNINWTQVHDFLDVCVLVFGAAAMGMLIYLRGIFVPKTAMADATAKFEQAITAVTKAAEAATKLLEQRVGELERRTDGKANKDEIRRLDIEHAKLDGLFQRVDHSVGALENAVDRIEGILLREAGQ